MIEALLYSAIAPFGLLLLSGVWRYPPVLEEVVKWGIIKSKVNQVHQVNQGYKVWSLGAQVGLVFGLAEAMLYTANAWQSGEWETIILRLAITVPMHAATAGITGWGISRGQQYIALALAMTIHGLFNYFVR